ncbi:MAG TPA: hypothetical protein VF116_02995 [Ktedonobacterales bacterium]
MLDLLRPLLLASTLVLVIPAAIVAGHRRPHGAIVVSAGASFAASAIFWLVLGGPSLFFFGGGSENLAVRLVVFFGDLLLWTAGWALALNAAAQARSWRWVALLTLCGPLSCFAFLVSLAPPQPCFFGPPPQPQGFGGALECPAPNPALQLLVIALYLVAPAAALAYALRDRLPVRRVGPRDIAISSAEAATDVDTADADAELEMRTERI